MHCCTSVLVGNAGNSLSCPLVALHAAINPDFIYGRSCWQSENVHSTFGCFGNGLFRVNDTADPHHDVRGDEAGLYQDRLGKRTWRKDRRHSTCLEECVNPDNYVNWRAIRQFDWWSSHNRKYI